MLFSTYAQATILTWDGTFPCFLLICLDPLRNHRHTHLPFGPECSQKPADLVITHLYDFPYQPLLSLFMGPTVCLFIHFTSIVEHLDGPDIGINQRRAKQTGPLIFESYRPAGATEQSTAITTDTRNTSCHGNT